MSDHSTGRATFSGRYNTRDVAKERRKEEDKEKKGGCHGSEVEIRETSFCEGRRLDLGIKNKTTINKLRRDLNRVYQ